MLQEPLAGISNTRGLFHSVKPQETSPGNLNFLFGRMWETHYLPCGVIFKVPFNFQQVIHSEAINERLFGIHFQWPFCSCFWPSGKHSGSPPVGLHSITVYINRNCCFARCDSHLVIIEFLPQACSVSHGFCVALNHFQHTWPTVSKNSGANSTWRLIKKIK